MQRSSSLANGRTGCGRVHDISLRYCRHRAALSATQHSLRSAPLQRFPRPFFSPLLQCASHSQWLYRIAWPAGVRFHRSAVLPPSKPGTQTRGISGSLSVSCTSASLTCTGHALVFHEGIRGFRDDVKDKRQERMCDASLMSGPATRRGEAGFFPRGDTSRQWLIATAMGIG